MNCKEPLRKLLYVDVASIIFLVLLMIYASVYPMYAYQEGIGATFDLAKRSAVPERRVQYIDEILGAELFTHEGLPCSIMGVINPTRANTLGAVKQQLEDLKEFFVDHPGARSDDLEWIDMESRTESAWQYQNLRWYFYHFWMLQVSLWGFTILLILLAIEESD
jgi:hypothetical protein